MLISCSNTLHWRPKTLIGLCSRLYMQHPIPTITFHTHFHFSRKRRSTISPTSVLTDNYQYEEVQDRLHILMPELRRSDGRSASSSDAETEESRSPSPTSTSQDSNSGSVGLNAEETSPLLESIANDRFQRALTANANSSEILCIPTETQTLGQLPLDPRQDPDGCSLSSSSSESNLLQSSP